MSFSNVFAVVTVTDWEAALVWYERFFGRPADRTPMNGLAEWQLTADGGFQVVQDAERGGSALVTLTPDDLESCVADLAKRDISDVQVVRGDVAAFAQVSDPEGNTITLAQDLDGG